MSVTFDLLSHHDTICEFLGIEHFPCRCMTADCPDHCDHASDVAVFKVLEYKEYKLCDKYGDEKQDTIMCEIKKKVFNQDPAIAEECKKLKKGQKVEVVYDHLYVHDHWGSSPERPVISIKEL